MNPASEVSQQGLLVPRKVFEFINILQNLIHIHRKVYLINLGVHEVEKGESRDGILGNVVRL